MMRLRRCALLVAAVTLIASSPAADGSAASARAVVTPSNGHVLAEWYKTLLEMPAAVNPLFGTGEDPCVEFGPRGKLLSAISFGEVTCTAEFGTVLTTGWSNFCSSFDEEGTEFHAIGKQEQRTCARALSRAETALSVTVDGQTVDIFKPQFTAFTPQTSVRLPADNVFGAPEQTATITAYGWTANIHNLDVGRHLITTTIVLDGETLPFHHVIDIVPPS